MFGLFKGDPAKKLDKSYHAKLKAAMEAQRAGDIRLYSELSSEAETLYAEWQAVKTK